MTGCRRRAAWALVVLLGALTLVAEDTPPAGPQWGKSLRSMELGVDAGETARMLGQVPVRVLVKVPAEALKGATQYAVLAQHQQAWFTQETPVKLAPGPNGALAATVDIGPMQAYRYRQGTATQHGYPVLAQDARPAGAVQDLVGLGPIIVVWAVCIPATADRPEVILHSGKLTIDVKAPDLASLAPERRQAFVDGIIKGFLGNAAAAMRAHDIAIELGPDILPPLLKLVQQKDLGEHGRMWLATALADLGGDQAAATLTAMMGSASSGLQNVIAYHGPKCRSAALDAAIITACEKASPETIAWALRGFSTFRHELPAKLLDLGQNNAKPELRATVVEVLSQCPSPEWKPRILAFLADPHPRVRGAAAVAAARLGYDGKPFLQALVKALDGTDDAARQLICQTLGTFAHDTGHAYDPEADDAAHQATIAWWQAWLAKRQ